MVDVNELNGMNGWTKWSMYVLKELQRLGQCILDLFSKLNKLDRRVDKLETKTEVTTTKMELSPKDKKAVGKISVWTSIGLVALIEGILKLIEFLINKYGG